MATSTETAPSTRKYEVGTALDYNRVFRNYDGTIMENDAGASIPELRAMVKNDPQAHQLARAMRLPVKNARWDIIAGEDDSGEKELIEWALHASSRQGGMTTPLKSVISQMANAFIYRFAPFEKVWKIADRGPFQGKAVLHKLGYRPPGSCRILSDANGSFDGFQQEVIKNNKYSKVNFDPRRSVVYIHGADEEPLLGSTSFDPVYNMYKFKQKISFFYFAFLENVAFPRTLVRVENDDPEALQYLLDKAKKLASQGILGLYEEESIESYESQRNTRDYQSCLEWLDWQMARACLSQFLDLGTTGERGSFALSKDKSAFFFLMMDATLQDIAATMNNYVIADIVQYNFGRDASYPHLKFRPLNDENAQPILDMYRDVIMSNAPNVTPPFLLGLMKRVEEILDLKIDPLAEYDEAEIKAIIQTIPTAREHLMSKESRAGSGQNPVTGQDRNRNNKNPDDDTSDNKDIVSQLVSPKAPKTPSRRKKDEDDN